MGFDFAATTNRIASLGSRRVALQFSEEVKWSAAAVALELERLVPETDVFILGDVMKHVDAVGAAHVDADLIVKYGDDCLSAPPDDCPPILYLLGREADVVLPDLDVSLVLFEVKYRTAAGRLNGVVAQLPKHVTGRDTVGLTIGGLVAEVDDASLSSSRVVFVGSEEASREAALRCGACESFVVYDPERESTQSVNVARRLAKRQHRLQRASGAKRWGVVVAAAGRLDLSSEVADACDSELTDAGRSSYILAVGVPTPAKLANFAEIEAFVVVGDAMSLDKLGDELAVPVVSPHEMRVALGLQEWLPTPQDNRIFYSTDLRDALSSSSSKGDASSKDDDAPAFNLAAAQLTDTRRAPPSRSLRLGYDEGALVTTTDLESRSSAVGFLQSREWRGLEVGAVVPSSGVVEGKSGVASGYANEPSYSVRE